MAVTFFDSWMNYQNNVMYRGITAPRSSDYKMILTNGGNINKASSVLDIARAMVEPNNGYEEAVFQPTVDATFDTTQNRSEVQIITVNFTALDAPIQYDRVVLIADRPHSVANGLKKKGSRTVQTIDATANKLVFPVAVPLDVPASENVVILPQASGTVPPELLVSGNTAMFSVRSSPTDTAAERSLQLNAPGTSTLVDFAAGVNPIRVVYATGKPVAFESYGAKTIEAGKSVSIVIAINLGGSTVDVDAA
jgi:hypothetical protein